MKIIDSQHNESVVRWHIITLYPLFVLCHILVMEWCKPKHRAEACESDYKLCFNLWVIIFPLLKSYMFQDQASILDKSTRTKEYKFNMLM